MFYILWFVTRLTGSSGLEINYNYYNRNEDGSASKITVNYLYTVYFMTLSEYIVLNSRIIGE
jgi:hypothetical protein